MKKILLAVAISSSFSAITSFAADEASPAIYQDTSVQIQTRVKDLVSRMTLEEKIGQMYNDAPAIERLNVPAYDYWNEALHGVARAGQATVFPQAIGLAAMWDDEMLHTVATAISDEARAKYHFYQREDIRYRYTGLTFWSPNINIFRDPRWGRGQETYGEDPFLTGELGVAFIKGLQGDNPDYLKTAATAKHFAVHNGPEISRHSDNYVVSDKDLYDTYLPAFKKAVEEADVEAVMCAYNRVNGMPACGSDMLLKEVLRDEYGFDGHVMSDCGAIRDFYDPKAHNVVEAPAAAAAWAVKSGTDLNCGTGALSTFANLGFAVQKGLIDEALIDQAVERLFMTRFKLGMFDGDNKTDYAAIPMDVVGSDAHMKLTETASASSLVLLKNNGLLPLTSDKKVAVIGPNANNEDVLLGNYNGIPINPVTPLQGLEAHLGKDNVTYSPGSAIIDDIYGHAEILDSRVLFHKKDDGSLAPGLTGKYYSLARGQVSDYITLTFPVTVSDEPQLTRVDKAMDFYFERSPIDESVLGNFGVIWEGVIQPEHDGKYQFDSDAQIKIDGKTVTDTVALKAAKAYPITISMQFADNKVSNTSAITRKQFTVRWVNTSEDLQQQAVNVANNADVIVAVVGITPRIEGEEMPVKLDGFNYGDRTDIDLPDEQQALLMALKKTGKPVVLVNFSGSAMALNWADENVDAIVQAFYPGEATGTALAKILYGESNPSGRLPVTFYRNLNGFADFDDYAMDNRTYRYYTGDVLYPFGHGLDYSDVTYSDLQAPSTLQLGEPLSVTVTLENASDFSADQVTQAYVKMPDAPTRVPRVALKAFSKDQVKPGTTETITLTIDADELTYINDNGESVAYTGSLHLFVGDGQPAHAKEKKIQHAVINIAQ